MVQEGYLQITFSSSIMVVSEGAIVNILSGSEVESIGNLLMDGGALFFFCVIEGADGAPSLCHVDDRARC
jgi:hypothetical protein